MPRLDTWEAYAEFSGGIVKPIVRGTTREDAEAQARRYIDYDAHEMDTRVRRFAHDDDSTVWITDGELVGAYREWED